MTIVTATTNIFPKNKMKSPTLFITASLKILSDIALNAFFPPVQKSHP